MSESDHPHVNHLDIAVPPASGAESAVDPRIDSMSAAAPVRHRIGRPWAAESMGTSAWRWLTTLVPGLAAFCLAMVRGHDLTGHRSWPVTLAWAASLGILPLIAVVDARIKIIPNRILYPLALLDVILLGIGVASGGLGLHALLGALAVAGGLGVYTLTIWFFAPGGFGLGDVKLMALLGLILGLHSIMSAVVGLVILPPLLAIVPMVVLAARIDAARRRQRAGKSADQPTAQFAKATLPFGPFIAAGALVMAFEPIYDARLHATLPGIFA